MSLSTWYQALVLYVGSTVRLPSRQFHLEGERRVTPRRNWLTYKNAEYIAALSLKSLQFSSPLDCLKVNIIPAVDGLGNSKNLVSDLRCHIIRSTSRENRLFNALPGLPRRSCELSSMSSILHINFKRISGRNWRYHPQQAGGMKHCNDFADYC